MVVRPSWPATRAFGAGLLLCAVAGVAAVRFAPQLGWAARELPRYLSGHIGSPPERQWYRQGRELVRQGRDLPAARELLERAAAIDPTCEAVLGLAEWDLAAGQVEPALAGFLRYVELDPTAAEAYLGAAASLVRLGRPEEARDLLRRGRQFLHAEGERHVPRTDTGVAARCNAKAIRVYQAFGESAERLRRALARIEPNDPAGAP
jgi:tetratricopeptide (TPR) repeat protein